MHTLLQRINLQFRWFFFEPLEQRVDTGLFFKWAGLLGHSAQSIRKVRAIWKYYSEISELLLSQSSHLPRRISPFLPLVRMIYDIKTSSWIEQAFSSQWLSIHSVSLNKFTLLSGYPGLLGVLINTDRSESQTLLSCWDHYDLPFLPPWGTPSCSTQNCGWAGFIIPHISKSEQSSRHPTGARSTSGLWEVFLEWVWPMSFLIPESIIPYVNEEFSCFPFKAILH